MAAISSRYARAFVEVVFEQKLDPAKTAEQLHAVEQVLAENPQLRHIWDNPAVPAAPPPPVSRPPGTSLPTAKP